MEHPRTHSATATANTPSSTRNSSTSSSNNPPSTSKVGSNQNSSNVGTSSNSLKRSSLTLSKSSSSSSKEDLSPVDIDIDLETETTTGNTCVRDIDVVMDSTNNTLNQNLMEEEEGSNNDSFLPKNSIMDDYTDSSLISSKQRNNGVITPSNLEQSPVERNIFKQFDSKTGQFLSSNNNNTDGENLQQINIARERSKEPIPPKDNIPFNNQIHEQPMPIKNQNQNQQSLINSIHNNNNNNNNNSNIQPSFRILSRIRSRSNSVPTILHSSLKRLSNHGHYHRNSKLNPNISNINFSGNSNINNSTIMTHPMNLYGVMKKKSIRPYPQFLQSNNLSSSTNLSSSSLRQAILLTQEAINTSSASSSSSSPHPPSNKNIGSNNNNQQNVSRTNKNPYINENVNINIHNNNNLSDSNNDFIITFEDRVNYVKALKLPIPLPPINIQCLKEIDLQEIVKNPQLRHDIIFDPLLQFRPNLDGERGIKKKHLSDIYWKDVENELIVYAKRPDIFRYDRTRLVPLFDTLREVLLTIVPQKEAHQINNILDTELNVQELIKGSLVMTNLSDWLATLFKHHCAPMRDTYVDKMSNKFREADAELSLTKFMDGLRLVFQILEAMKLDIANHQIRLLRPALLSNAVEFEKQYFNSLILSRNALLKSSLLWFDNKFSEYITSNQIVIQDQKNITFPEVYKGWIKSVISLLSCRKMVREFPASLSFDHARLILLRADIRQLVCLLVCRLLFQQLVANDNSLDKSAKMYISTTYSNKRLKEEITSIITDGHGNCRWTKNTLSIAVHLCKIIDDLKKEYNNKQNIEHNNITTYGGDITMEDTEDEPENSSANITSTTSTTITSSLAPALDNEKIRFAKAWLSKQTQPLSEVYGVLENRVFKSLEDGVYGKSNCTVDGRVKQDFVYLYNGTTPGNNATPGNTTDENNGTNTNISFKANDNKNKDATGSNNNNNNPSGGLFAFADSEEFENVYRHLYTVINLHWSVFGPHYIDSLGDKIAGRG